MCPYTLCPCENNTMGSWWVWVADPWWDHAQWKWIDGYWQKWHEICWHKATMGEAWWNSYWQTLRWHSTERNHNDIIAQKEKKIAKVSTLWIASLLHGPIRLGIRVVYLLYSKSYSGCKIDLCYDLAISLLDISFILLYGMIICPTVFCASNRKHIVNVEGHPMLALHAPSLPTDSYPCLFVAWGSPAISPLSACQCIWSLSIISLAGRLPRWLHGWHDHVCVCDLAATHYGLTYQQ